MERTEIPNHPNGGSGNGAVSRTKGHLERKSAKFLQRQLDQQFIHNTGPDPPCNTCPNDLFNKHESVVSRRHSASEPVLHQLRLLLNVEIIPRIGVCDCVVVSFAEFIGPR
jgi:hypothetical protein